MSWPPLLPDDGLAAWPGGPFDQAVVEQAESTIRGECGWHIAPVITETLVVDNRAKHGAIVLPSLRVVEVLDVVADPDTDDELELGGWRWSVAGILTRAEGWPTGLRSLQVQMRHGYDETPAELLALAAELARAAAVNEPGVRQWTRTVGSITNSRTYVDTGALNATLTAAQRVLGRYRVGEPTW